jgi:hypothetical protein
MRQQPAPYLHGVRNRFDPDRTGPVLLHARSGKLAAQANGSRVVRDRRAVFEDELSVLCANLRYPALDETTSPLLNEPADIDTMLLGSVGAGDHTRRHPRVVQVRRQIHEGDVETPPDEISGPR